MRHKRILDKHYYKEWCPDLKLVEYFVFRVDTSQYQQKIDLHGLTVNEAYLKTLEFIETSHKNNLPHIRIITGASGSIKKEFTNWICGNKIVRKFEKINSGEFKIWLIKSM